QPGSLRAARRRGQRHPCLRRAWAAGHVPDRPPGRGARAAPRPTARGWARNDLERVLARRTGARTPRRELMPSAADYLQLRDRAFALLSAGEPVTEDALLRHVYGGVP